MLESQKNAIVQSHILKGYLLMIAYGSSETTGEENTGILGFVSCHLRCSSGFLALEAHHHGTHNRERRTGVDI